MKVYALETKTEIHRGFFNEILRDFRAASFENNFGGAASEKKTEEEKDPQ